MTTAQLSSGTALEVTRQTFADPSLARRGPGEEFAWAVSRSRHDGDVVVPIHAYLPSAFPLFSTRPRYTVRHLLKVASVYDGSVAYVREAARPGHLSAGTSYQDTPESAFSSTMDWAKPTELSLTVALPAGLVDDPALLAAFVDYRVLVRLGVVENQALLHGTADRNIAGLLNLPVRRAPLQGSPGAALFAAAGEVEETGGSCDGIVAHPSLYWQLVADGTLGRLAEVGVKVSRTRMMPRGQALLGDFRAAVTLLDPGSSTLALSRGTAPGGGDTVEVRTRVGLAVHLPQHFLLLARDDEGSGS
jgi:hypothetical protein